MALIIIIAALGLAFLLVKGLLLLMRALGSNMGGHGPTPQDYWETLPSAQQEALTDGMIAFGRDPGFFHLHQLRGHSWKNEPKILDWPKDALETGLNLLKTQEFCRHMHKLALDPNQLRVSYCVSRSHGALFFDTGNIRSGAREILDLAQGIKDFMAANRQAFEDQPAFFAREDFLDDPVGCSLRYLCHKDRIGLPKEIWNTWNGLLEDEDLVSLALIHGAAPEIPFLRDLTIRSFPGLSPGALELFLARFQRKLNATEQRQIQELGFSSDHRRNQVILQLVSVELLAENPQALMREEIMEDPLARGAALKVFDRQGALEAAAFLQDYKQYGDVQEKLRDWRDKGLLASGAISISSQGMGELEIAQKTPGPKS